MSYSNVNRVVLIGRLTQDPELRALPSGKTVCNLRVACNGTRRNPEGEYKERAGFFNVSVFGTRGESVQRYMRRGRLLAIDGRLDWREWETQEGSKRQAVEIVAENVQFLDGPNRHETVASSGRDGSVDGSGLSGESIEDPSGSDSDSEGSDGVEPRELVGVGSSIEDDVVF